MNSPYTDHASEAFQAAEVALGAVSTVVLLASGPRRPPLRSFLAAAAIWGAVFLPLWPLVASAWVVRRDDAAQTLVGYAVLEVILALASIAPARPRRTVAALAVVGATAALSRWITDSTWELCNLHVIAAWVVWAIHEGPLRASAAPGAPAASPAKEPSERVEDAVVFGVATLVGALVSTYVLERGIDSSDEWGYTYQAALFAKGHLHGKVPPCTESLRNFWIIWRDDRMFAQYQPGWPIFMVPFVWLRAPWLAGPVSFAILVTAGSRVARIAVREATGSAASARTGGRVAAFGLLLANTLLINGGSRFPHVFVCALWCVAIEATHRLVRAPTPRDANRAAAVLGCAAGWLVCTRVPEGLLTAGLLAAVLVALVRKKVAFGPVLVAGLVSVGWVLVLLGISRAQTGRWGELGYSVATEFYPWNHYKQSLPPPNAIKWHVPLATGAYSWWPIAPAIGLAGTVLGLRTRARGLLLVIASGCLLTLGYYASIEVGRGGDFGHGPRYQMVVVVPTAIGMALVVHHARLAGRALAAAGALAVAGSVMVAIYTLPYTHGMLADGMAIEKAAERARLHDAIVLVPPGTHRYGDYDVTRNYPIELYDPPVIYANEKDVACLRRTFPSRTILRVTSRTNPGFARP